MTDARANVVVLGALAVDGRYRELLARGQRKIHPTTASRCTSSSVMTFAPVVHPSGFVNGAPAAETSG